jgi:hypothetical protein
VAQVRHVDRAEITFHGNETSDGGFQLEARGGDFVLRKKSKPNGRFSLDLEAAGDKVAIDFTGHSIAITRNKKRLVIAAETGTEKDFDDARVLLASSLAVRRSRAAAAAIEDAGDDSAASIGLLIADTLVGMLTGDAGAPGRMARYLSRHARSNTKQIATRDDCYKTWERRVLRASYEWESCVRDFSVWNPVRNVCALRWTLQVESYWFSFLSCTGFNTF